ncbi:glycosyltransferase family 4 protein [aff. Roholtiella sp. LEGE 12411]|uniref:glycosyltransferase family 4 protein n=1 Tax=aff. Roholtiella sp. LEGE 12411 TaxID=1828822 RepID=UPI00187F8F92|nr:glycosyltransferase family 4 protein [aff. Roholtiella sp. LEGE 12411]MBE9033722.1 glycosyltransferase family 4 protein [aff. Roholtiella sp. LEGE 12411]
MKLLIQHRHSENEIAGVLTYIYSIIPELETRGIEIKTISTKQDNLMKWLNHIVWADIVHMNSNNLVFALLCKALGKKIVIKYHYSFYHTTHINYETMTFGKRLQAELKHTLPKANYPLKWKLHTAVKWMRLAIRLSTALIADYHTACSNFLAESSAFPWSVETLYNPIEINKKNQQKHLKLLSNPYKFVFLGRLDGSKGVDILLKAVRILQEENHEFEVLIIGNGIQASELKQLASDLGILSYVSFLGKLPNQEALVKVQDALALAAPSRWQEPAGYVVLEASSVQTCSIVSKMGGLPEVAGPHSLFFENEDAEGLASCMRYCLNNPDEAIKRGFQSSQYVAENFSPARAATQLLEICCKLSPKVLAKTYR